MNSSARIHQHLAQYAKLLKKRKKITVYLSPDELFDLDQARLTLRGDLGLAVDRGRIVRESIAVIVADLEAKGDQSILARRLRGI
jgi:hypothetical protein